MLFSVVFLKDSEKLKKKTFGLLTEEQEDHKDLIVFLKGNERKRREGRNESVFNELAASSLSLTAKKFCGHQTPLLISLTTLGY